MALVPLVMLAVVTGTRYYMGGYDIYNYEYTFNTIPSLSNFHLWETFKTYGFFGSDIGYRFINSLIKSLGFNFFGFTLIVSFFFYICVYFGLSKFSNNMNIVVIILMYKEFLGLTFIYMRQSIAVGFFLLSLRFLFTNRPFRYVLTILVASTIHFSAIFLLPLYLLKFVRLTKKGIIIYSCVFTVSYVVSLSNINILGFMSPIAELFSGSAQEKISSVAGDSDLYQGGTSILHLVEFLVVDMLLIYIFNHLTLNQTREWMIKLFLCVLPFYSILAGEGILARIPFYLLLSYAFIIDYFVDNSRHAVRALTYLAVIIVCFGGMYMFAQKFDGGEMLLYRSFLHYNLSIFN
ncbi:EpsG family protein [Lapidilactobacillus gannanensis]|uniref:EpsG family protein n=2 Tax=Lapidilactobacillus gannanensis TaxID=2486002 RepID=A0ABW4BNU7_9LACO